MTDIELLTLAAKAAGVAIKFPYAHGVAIDVSPRRTDTWENWNPLTDDGDALRLAVKLKIRIYDDGYAMTPSGQPCIEDSGEPLADTRRAIVRAAADIGEAMP